LATLDANPAATPYQDYARPSKGVGAVASSRHRNPVIAEGELGRPIGPVSRGDALVARGLISVGRPFKVVWRDRIAPSY
jgi:hypothetical protein